MFSSLCIIIIFELLKILLVTSLKYKFSLGQVNFFHIKIFIHDNLGRDLLIVQSKLSHLAVPTTILHERKFKCIL